MNQDEKNEQLNIFLVEDETELNRNLITIFRDNGWSVRGYLTYKSAYMALKNEKPACNMFLLDVILPEGSGYELCRRIRESYGSDVIIIFITGCDDEESLIKGFDAGGGRLYQKALYADRIVCENQGTPEKIHRLKPNFAQHRHGG